MKAFYTRRILRILPPLYFYCLALAIISYFWLIDITHTQIIKAGLFLCNLDLPGGCSWFVGHTWSLAYEEQFYLIFPLLFAVIGFVTRPQILLGMILSMVVISIVLRGAGFDWLAGYLSHMVFMLVGCAAALYWSKLTKWISRFSVNYWFVALVFLVLCVGLLPYPLEAYFKTAIYPLLIGYLVLATPNSNLKLGNFFDNSQVVYLGKISYTVYLWQQLATASYPSISAVWNIVFIAGVWLFAHFSYQYFERPLIGVAHRWSTRIQQRESLSRTVKIKSV